MASGMNERSLRAADERERQDRAEAAALALRLRETQEALLGLGRRLAEVEKERQVLAQALTDANSVVAAARELLARPNEITTVKIRFGLMGNKDWSAYYHRQIMKILRIPDQP